MSDCTLQKLGRFELSEIIHDDQAGMYSLRIKDNLDSCPSHVLNSHSATVQQIAGNTSYLTYSESLRHPVILKANSTAIVHVNSDLKAVNLTPADDTGSSVGLILFIVLLGFLVLWFIKKAFERPMVREIDLSRSSVGSSSSYRSSGGYVSGSGGSNTTIVNNNSGSDGFVTGMLVGEALSDRSSRHSDSSGGSYTTDTSPSYSSDSSDSYSSDSSSSSSDSFSSDSSSSFGGDSGGSSFGSD